LQGIIREGNVTEESKVEEALGETPVSEEPQVERSIADELERMGQQLAGAAKAAWESDERKKLQAEIAAGMQRFGQEVTAAFEKATASDQAKELRTRAEKVATDVQKTDVVDEVRKGLLVGLEAINRELGKLLERLESKAGETEVGGPAADSAAGENVEAAEMPVAPEEPSPTD
jgi:hypothetical protein